MDVSISGHKKEDPLSQLVIDKQVRNELSRISRMMELQHISIHIDRYNESGSRVKYSLKAKIITATGAFFAKDHAWDLSKALSGVLGKLEREVKKERDKQRDKHL